MEPREFIDTLKNEDREFGLLYNEIIEDGEMDIDEFEQEVIDAATAGQEYFDNYLECMYQIHVLGAGTLTSRLAEGILDKMGNANSHFVEIYIALVKNVSEAHAMDYVYTAQENFLDSIDEYNEFVNSLYEAVFTNGEYNGNQVRFPMWNYTIPKPILH